MNPQQNQSPPQTGSSYDFFLNPAPPPKRSVIPGGFGTGGSLVKRLVAVGALFFIVIIFVIIGLSILHNSGKQPKLLVVVQDQNELIRVATEATSNGQQQSAQSTLNFATSAMLSLATEQQQLISYMSSHGNKPSSAQLSATKNASTDTELNNAVASSTFNAVFVGVMQNELKSYETDLQNAYQSANTATEQQLLSDDFSAAKLLLQQLNSPTQ